MMIAIIISQALNRMAAIRSGRGLLASAMRITKRQAEENRAKVVETAARLVREKGFEGIGVADLMRAAGMTHGGFYNHFESKDELNAAACGHALSQAVAAIEGVVQGGETLAAYRGRYLSRKSRDAEGFRCPMVAFGNDVSRQGPALRDAYAKGLRRYLDAFARAYAAERNGEVAAELRAEAITHFATMVGAVSLARSIAKDDPALSDEILEATLGRLEAPAARGHI
jgi:TetR/AcrR family transcriptional regulator, transcriptional repressor for nem operon